MTVVELPPSFEPRVAMTISTMTTTAATAMTAHAVGLNVKFVVVVVVDWLELVVGAVVGTVWVCCDVVDEAGGAV